MAISLSSLFDIIDKKINDPCVNIMVRCPKQGEYVLKISKKQKRVRSLDINFPVLGRVTDILDFSSNTERQNSDKKVLGSQLTFAQNNVLISITEISKSSNLEYRIYFEPFPESAEMIKRFKASIKDNFPINVKGNDLREILYLDRFSYRYTWEHGNDIMEKEKWISLKEMNKEVEKPKFSIEGLILGPTKIVGEQFKKDQKEDIKIHQF